MPEKRTWLKVCTKLIHLNCLLHEFIVNLISGAVYRHICIKLVYHFSIDTNILRLGKHQVTDVLKFLKLHPKKEKAGF